MRVPAVVFTDLHVDDYKSFSENGERLEHCLKVLDDVFKLAHKKNSKIILFSGDMYNTVKVIATVVVDAVITRLANLFSSYPDINIYAITGNHDFATKNLPHKPTVSALNHLSVTFPGRFNVIDNRIVPVTDDYTICVAGIPNYEYSEHFRQQLEEMASMVAAARATMDEQGESLTATLLIHQKPSGNPNPNVRIDTDVYDPLYDVFDMVLCGDIHHRAHIRDKFVILGNPLHKDLSDEGEEKGIWVVDLANPVETLKFVSRKGRYPEFIRVKAGERYDDKGNFVIVEPGSSMTITDDSKAGLEEFSATLPHAQLVENFYKVSGMKDPDLLKTGLKFV